MSAQANNVCVVATCKSGLKTSRYESNIFSRDSSRAASRLSEAIAATRMRVYLPQQQKNTQCKEASISSNFLMSSWLPSLVKHMALLGMSVLGDFYRLPYRISNEIDSLTSVAAPISTWKLHPRLVDVTPQPEDPFTACCEPLLLDKDPAVTLDLVTRNIQNIRISPSSKSLHIMQEQQSLQPP